MTDRYDCLREAFDLRRRDGARHRDIATALSVAEGELIAAHAGIRDEDPDPRLHAIRLTADWPAIVAALESLGDVMALTRNDACVHEKIGRYRHASERDGVGLVLGGAIDLRVFYRRWAHGFAVQEHTERGLQRSLQFFDAAGTAVHKVFLRDGSDLPAWGALVARFGAPVQTPGLAAPDAPAATAPSGEDIERPDADIDVAALREGWAALRDTHAFHGLLRRLRVSRTQALRLADPAFARPVETTGAGMVLEQAARDQVSIMVFTGNPGMIQIHTGPIGRVATMGPWVNVLDPDFNLHLREDAVAQAWLVRKPTVDGTVTSLELYDARGETIAMFFGERKPGRPESCEWRLLVERLLKEPMPCAA